MVETVWRLYTGSIPVVSQIDFETEIEIGFEIEIENENQIKIGGQNEN